MPNYVKYSTSIPSGSLLKGTVALGINDNVIGPTSTTGWYTGINLASGSYIIYEVAASGDPDIYCPQNDTELFNLVRSKGATGGNTGSVAAALAWIATQPNLLATNEVYPNIVTSGSVMNLDGGFVGSYPTTASIWYDVSGNNNSGSLINGPVFNPNGYITFDGTNNYSLVSNSISLQPPTSLTLECLLKPTTIVGGSFIIAYTGDAPGSYVKYGFRVSSGLLSGYINSNGPIAQTFGNTLVTGSWIHGILTYDGTSAKLYCNGVLSNTTAITGSMDYNAYGSPYFLTMGRKNTIDGQYFNGSISNARVYSYAFSQSEVSQNYYQAPIVTSGLVLAVDAGNLVSYESGSTTTYSLTGSISGSLVNGTGYSNVNGGAWNFDFVDDYIDCGNNAVLNVGNNISVFSWFYVTTTSSFQVIVAKSANNNGWELDNSNGTLRCTLRPSVANNNNITAGTLVLNNWYYGGFTCDNTTIRLYLNGVQQGTTAVSSITLNNTGSLFIGRRADGANTNYFNGKISITQIYNRALTATEVSQNFNAQSNRFGF